MSSSAEKKVLDQDKFTYPNLNDIQIYPSQVQFQYPLQLDQYYYQQAASYNDSNPLAQLSTPPYVTTDINSQHVQASITAAAMGFGSLPSYTTSSYSYLPEYDFCSPIFIQSPSTSYTPLNSIPDIGGIEVGGEVGVGVGVGVGGGGGEVNSDTKRSNNEDQTTAFKPTFISESGVPLKRSRDYLQGRRMSSIAGIVYNSSAVNKRLKTSKSCISTSSSSSSINSNSYTSTNSNKNLNSNKFIKNKTQGRPFSNNFNGRLVLHSNIKSLLSYMDKRSDNKFAIYDWSIPISNQKPLTNDIKNLLNQNETSMLHNFELDDLKSNDLDSLLKFKANEILHVNGYKEKSLPKSSPVKYDPKRWTNLDSMKLDDKLKFLNVPLIDLIINSSCNDGGVINFHKIVVNSFGIDDYVFVKTIRDNNGHVLKIETMKPPTNDEGIYEYTPEWIKRFVCYPRYKSGMNLQLLSQTSDDFIIYNNFKMLFWEIKQRIDNPNLNDNNIIQNLLTDEIHSDLFHNRKTYINLSS